MVNVSSIVWATGYKPDFSWIDPDITDKENGWPVTKKGVSVHIPGMYFMGMIFQYGLTSGLVGGVGRDAAVYCEEDSTQEKLTRSKKVVQSCSHAVVQSCSLQFCSSAVLRLLAFILH